MKNFLKYLLISIGVVLVVAAFLIPDSVVIEGKKESKKKRGTDSIPPTDFEEVKEETEPPV